MNAELGRPAVTARVHRPAWGIGAAVLCATVSFLVLSPAAHAYMISPTSGTVVASSGTNFSLGPRNLQFAFEYFGASQSGVYLNSNGNLSFGMGSTGFGNAPLPDVAPPRISAFWDYLPTTGGQIREVNASTYYAAIWNNVGVGTNPANRVTVEALLLGAGNPFGLAANTIAFSYGPVGGVFGDATVGLSQGNGVGYATLSALGVGAANGKVNQAQAVALSDFTYCFTADAGGAYTAHNCHAVVDASGLETWVASPEPSTLVLWGVGMAVLARRLRRRT